MKRFLVIAATVVAATGCANARNSQKPRNPYESPFYAKYLNTGTPLDATIEKTLAALRQNPKSAQLHNELGTLLVQKGFPKDAEREFERALNIDSHYYQAWYNLGLVRTARGETASARHAFYRTVALKPGHAAALFQLGLIEESRGNTDRAVGLYSKALSINPALLDVGVNPRILDSKLIHLALIEAYPDTHARYSMQFQGAPIVRDQKAPEAASPQAKPEDVVTPAPPATDPSQQPHAAVVIPVTGGAVHAPGAGQTQPQRSTTTSGARAPRYYPPTANTGAAREERDRQMRAARRQQQQKQKQQGTTTTAPPATTTQPPATSTQPPSEDDIDNNPPDAVPPPPAA